MAANSNWINRILTHRGVHRRHHAPDRRAGWENLQLLGSEGQAVKPATYQPHWLAHLNRAIGGRHSRANFSA
jgi:hypothetical protein